MNQGMSGQLATKPLVFFHLPRTGGTSLINYLEKHFPPESICPAHEYPEFLALEEQKALKGYGFYRGHFGINFLKKLATDCVTITILREPIARLISTYKHLRQQDLPFSESSNVQIIKNIRSKVGLAKSEGPETFFRTIFERNEKSFFNQMTITLGLGRGPDVAALRIPLSEIMSRAKVNLSSFSFFGIMEKYDTSLTALSNLFGWDSVEFQTLNVSSANVEIESDLLDWLHDKATLDLELYAYAVKLFNERYPQ